MGKLTVKRMSRSYQWLLGLLFFFVVTEAYLYPDRLTPEVYKEKLANYKFKITAHANRDFKAEGENGCVKCQTIVGKLWQNAVTDSNGPQEPDLRAVIAFFHEEWDLHHHLQDHHVDVIKIHPLYTQKKLTKDFCGDHTLGGIAKICSQEELDAHNEL